MTRINTSKMLNNDGYYNGGIEAEVINNTNITVSPLVSDQYDYSVTDGTFTQTNYAMLPHVTADDNGKTLQVVNGQWTIV